MIGPAFVQFLGAAGKYASGLMSAQARRAEFAEHLRQFDLAKRKTVTTAQAAAAASGTEMDSTSTVDYLARLSNTYDLARGRMKQNFRLAERSNDLANKLGLVGAGFKLGGAVLQTLGASEIDPLTGKPIPKPGYGMKGGI